MSCPICPKSIGTLYMTHVYLPDPQEQPLSTLQRIAHSLYWKYNQSLCYGFTKPINSILCNRGGPAYIRCKDKMTLHENEECLYRLYAREEHAEKLRLFAEFYKYHTDIPRWGLDTRVIATLDEYYDRKRKLAYYQIQRIIERENQANPDRPPKGLVGEQPLPSGSSEESPLTTFQVLDSQVLHGHQFHQRQPEPLIIDEANIKLHTQYTNETNIEQRQVSPIQKPRVSPGRGVVLSQFDLGLLRLKLFQQRQEVLKNLSPAHYKFPNYKFPSSKKVSTHRMITERQVQTARSKSPPSKPHSPPSKPKSPNIASMVPPIRQIPKKPQKPRNKPNPLNTRLTTSNSRSERRQGSNSQQPRRVSPSSRGASNSPRQPTKKPTPNCFKKPVKLTTEFYHPSPKPRSPVVPKKCLTPQNRQRFDTRFENRPETSRTLQPSVKRASPQSMVTKPLPTRKVLTQPQRPRKATKAPKTPKSSLQKKIHLDKRFSQHMDWSKYALEQVSKHYLK